MLRHGESQPAFRSTSSTASGCFAITASSTRVGASGCDLPCSQFRSVAGGNPNLIANCAWLSPIFSRTFRTSTSGTCTSVMRTSSFSPLVHAIASFNPWMMLLPTVRGFRGRVVFFNVGLDVLFVVISDLLCLSRVPATSAGTERFIVFRSALLISCITTIRSLRTAIKRPTAEVPSCVAAHPLRDWSNSSEQGLVVSPRGRFRQLTETLATLPGGDTTNS